jgi:hypothetical protein
VLRKQSLFGHYTHNSYFSFRYLNPPLVLTEALYVNKYSDLRLYPVKGLRPCVFIDPNTVAIDWTSPWTLMEGAFQRFWKDGLFPVDWLFSALDETCLLKAPKFINLQLWRKKSRSAGVFPKKLASERDRLLPPNLMNRTG